MITKALTWFYNQYKHLISIMVYDALLLHDPVYDCIYLFAYCFLTKFIANKGLYGYTSVCVCVLESY